mmetsp:Transcript_20088/g.44728  ORF Transcript_20088/g.44728 Transcript_20088/m.44728 type:complete len:169 (-) Transcript_20088:27-533(-)
MLAAFFKGAAPVLRAGAGRHPQAPLALATSRRFRPKDQVTFGYSYPKRPNYDKTQRKPNVKMRPDDFSLGVGSNGEFYYKAPWPPLVNRSLQPGKFDKRKGHSGEKHQDFPLRWKNIEYKYTPDLTTKPNQGKRWQGVINRIDHSSGSKSKAGFFKGTGADQQSSSTG